MSRIRIGNHSHLLIPVPRPRPIAPALSARLQGRSRTPMSSRSSTSAERLSATETALSRSGALENAVVAIAGVGDIGSRVATSLAQAGVGRLAVADMDIVESGNLGQSAFRASDVGSPKVEAIQRMCRGLNPNIAIRTLHQDLRGTTLPKLQDWATRASVVVLSVDDPTALLRLHDLFFHGVPTVAAGIHEGGVSGHVVYTVPGHTACLKCALGIEGSAGLAQIRGNNAGSDDVERIASETASVTLALLDHSRSDRIDADRSRSLLFISNRWTNGFDAREARWLRVERRSDCPVCGWR